MSKVADIFRHRGEEIDPFLTREVELTRHAIDYQTEDNAVIVRPTIIAYEPLVMATGAIQMGQYGIQDFEATFGKLEINTRQLLVSYTALKHGLEQKRKDTRSRLHAELGALALETIDNHFMANKGDVHEVESDLIKYIAARSARRRVENSAHTNSQYARIPAKIQSAALGYPKHDVSKYKEERAKTMRFFGLSIPQIGDESIRRIILAARSRD